MKKTFALIVTAGMSHAAYAQDNPVPNYGTFGGSNARTFNFPSPYIFGDGSRTRVKWSKNLAEPPYSVNVSVGRSAMVLDESGDLYWQCSSLFVGVANAGLYKTRASDGEMLWRGPFTTESAPFAFFAPPIVGSSLVYTSRQSIANPSVYAVSKATGELVWESPLLPAPVVNGMSLLSGTLYGITSSISGVSTAFAINASTGQIIWTRAVDSFNSRNDRLGTTLVQNAFGPGQHGLYWVFDNGTPAGSGIRGLQVSPTGSGTTFLLAPTRTAISHVIYDQSANALYAPHYNDYDGVAIDAFTPFGDRLWVARSAEFGNVFNGGFTPAHALRPGGNGLIFAGFAGDFWMLNNPGSLAGAPLPTSATVWYYNGPDDAAEARDGAIVINDPTSGSSVYITGTSGSPSYARRLVAHNTVNGARLWEYIVPGPNPFPANGGVPGTFLSPIVDQRGDIYFGTGDQTSDPINAKLIALTADICFGGSAPTIGSQPVPVFACAAGSAMFAVTAAGTGPFTYQWQIQTGPNTWANLASDPGPIPCPSGETGTAFATPGNAAAVSIGVGDCAATPDSVWPIRCVVTNACGSVTSDTATLTILPGSDPACGGPACDPDVNQDGNADQGDIDYLINVIAGGDNPTGIDPDFNRDGNADQGDVDSLINVVAGGACP